MQLCHHIATPNDMTCVQYTFPIPFEYLQGIEHYEGIVSVDDQDVTSTMFCQQHHGLVMLQHRLIHTCLEMSCRHFVLFTAKKTERTRTHYQRRHTSWRCWNILYVFIRIKQITSTVRYLFTNSTTKIILHDVNDGAPARTGVSVDGVHERLRNGFKQYIRALENKKHNFTSLAYESC